MSNDKISDKRHLRSVATRQKLLEAAKEVFLEEGFQKATISQMIKKANIGYGTAYVHFEGKEDLLCVLMENVMAQFYEIAEISFFPKSKDEAEQIINKQTYSFLKMAEAERNMMQIFEQAIGVSSVISDKWKAIREKFIQRISMDIAYSQQNGLARATLNDEIVARGWFFTNEMYLWEIVRNEHHHSVEEIATTITSLYATGLYL
ncbi:MULTISPECIES: TetR/AcrR family transcriptional regulator [Paenibacillus]|uniref:TetR/AcrR family transcriptional regulator n=1 Tax=Paenibacillus oleatilyticus TaxID=2594886 RepID=A0ABV4UWV2_9BACL|nr:MULTISPECIES: TetR/AcrR family transcriptional regulator [Paenibacillus]MBU7321104.1 TetR/AcrR family transcriptional regulator [Paenibacillus oleatilyticus]GLI07967.1 TetR family transcriptional regulator [Paenibacillus tyrfis]GMX61202.1 TetR/AcrR family transcriptional regulator [Paenibacillus elgii]